MMKLHKIKHDLKTTLWCGPAALATLTGLPTSRIMSVLRAVTGRRTVKGIYNSDLLKAGAALGLEFFDLKVPFGDMTLARWTAENKNHLKGIPHIINVTGHYVTVCGGSFVDNWTKRPVRLKKAPHRRCRVQRVWAVRKSLGTPLSLPPEPLPEVRGPSGPQYGRKARDLARKHGIVLEVGDPSPDCIWVGPPPGLENDRHDGDHYCYDWDEALDRVKGYVEDLLKLTPAVSGANSESVLVPASVPMSEPPEPRCLHAQSPVSC